MKTFLGLTTAALIFLSGIAVGRYMLPAHPEKSGGPKTEVRTLETNSPQIPVPAPVVSVESTVSHVGVGPVRHGGPREKEGLALGPRGLTSGDLHRKELDAMLTVQKDDVQEPSNVILQEISEEQFIGEQRSSLRDDGISSVHEIESIIAGLSVTKSVPGDAGLLEH